MREEIDVLRKQTIGNPNNPEDDWKKSVRVAQYRYVELVKTIDRNMGKHPFNVGMRGIYVADSKDFNAPSYTAIRWLWRPFGNPQYMNHLRPRRWGNPYDWPWQDFKDMRWNLTIRRAMDAYRRRSHFYSPWILPHNMMSTEVIASLWHPPSASVATPGLERIAAKKGEPPANLPK